MCRQIRDNVYCASNGHVLNVKVRFPDAGSYDVDLFVKDVKDPGAFTSCLSYRSVILPPIPPSLSRSLFFQLHIVDRTNSTDSRFITLTPMPSKIMNVALSLGLTVRKGLVLRRVNSLQNTLHSKRVDFSSLRQRRFLVLSLAKTGMPNFCLKVPKGTRSLGALLAMVRKFQHKYHQLRRTCMRCCAPFPQHQN